MTAAPPAPVFLPQALEDPERLRPQLEAAAPYWNQARYVPTPKRAAAATTPVGHPFAMEGGAPPLFRGNWLERGHPVGAAADRLDVTWLVDAPRLMAAASDLFNGGVPEPTVVHVNLTAPMPGLDAGHVDVPSFRGMDRLSAPGWFLLAMSRSGLFEPWRERTATAVVWFYEGVGGSLTYWPAGPAGPPQVVDPVPNTALVGDNDRMFHRVDAVGRPERWRAVPSESLLFHRGGDRWEVRQDGEVLADYTFDELRVSLSWKATVPPTSSPGGRADLGLDELSTEAAVATMTSALEERGLWDRGPGALDDVAFVEVVMEAFPRVVPGGHEANDPRRGRPPVPANVEWRDQDSR